MNRTPFHPEYKAGDVVFGKFPLANGKVIRHYGVILQVIGEALLLGYITSIKEDTSFSNPATHFTKEDLSLSGMDKACRWDATTAAVVSWRDVQRRGRISDSTLEAILSSFKRAQKANTLSLAMLDYNKVQKAQNSQPCHRLNARQKPQIATYG